MTRKLALLFVLAAMTVAGTGCGDDCAVYCRNQANFIDTCLPEFDQEWTDVGDGTWEKKGDFVGSCQEQIDEQIEVDIEEACADAAEEDLANCESTIRTGVIGNCSDHLNDFQASCTDFWSDNTDFTPGVFDPPEPEGDDDDSAGDDDDSAGDDDDSAGDDDDVADDDDVVDDDDAVDDDDVMDDDDSAVLPDDDDSAPMDDDDSAAGDDDDSAR